MTSVSSTLPLSFHMGVFIGAFGCLEAQSFVCLSYEYLDQVCLIQRLLHIMQGSWTWATSQWKKSVFVFVCFGFKTEPRWFVIKGYLLPQFYNSSASLFQDSDDIILSGSLSVRRGDTTSYIQWIVSGNCKCYFWIVPCECVYKII